jgi:transposase-like protein
MARGRPMIGVDLVARLTGPRGQRRQLRILLGTLVGTVTIAQACAELGLGRAHQLRWRVLEGGMAALEPRPRGRPRVPVASPEVEQLQDRIAELELALQTTALRSEIALTMPHLLDRAARKKKGAPRRTRRAPARGPR